MSKIISIPSPGWGKLILDGKPSYCHIKCQKPPDDIKPAEISWIGSKDPKENKLEAKCPACGAAIYFGLL